LAQRRRPPPDLDLIEDGFVLTEEESREKRLTKQIINRRSKKVIIPPPVLSEEEFVQRCREEASNMLLGVRKKKLTVLFSLKNSENCITWILFNPRKYPHSHPTQGIGISWGSAGVLEGHKNVKKCMKLNWNHFCQGCMDIFWSYTSEKIPTIFFSAY